MNGNLKGVTAFIPVRGGSKSIPLKNIRSFCGKPLVNWYIEELNKCEAVQRIVVATDSEPIRETVKKIGSQKVEIFDRSPENARDTSSTESVMLEYLSSAGAPASGEFMLCQATSPYIRTAQLQQAIDRFYESGKDSLLSCSLQKKFYWSHEGKPLNYDPLNRPRRQDFNGMLVENGAFYLSTCDTIRKNACRISGSVEVFELPEYFLFEIDEPADWEIAEALMKNLVLKS